MDKFTIMVGAGETKDRAPIPAATARVLRDEAVRLMVSDYKLPGVTVLESSGAWLYKGRVVYEPGFTFIFYCEKAPAERLFSQIRDIFNQTCVLVQHERGVTADFI